MRKGFTLLEILLYIVIGGITLAIASFSFVQITRLSTSFRVNNELNQTGETILKQIQNFVSENADIIVSPNPGDTANSSLVLRKDDLDITIAQVDNNIIVSYSNGDPSFNLNPTGILVDNTPSPTLLFEQINSQGVNQNIGLSQSIKIQFTLEYNKPTFSTIEYDATKEFQATVTLPQRTSSFQPILNQYPMNGPGVAYSLRKLSGINVNSSLFAQGYSGPAIRVRRDMGIPPQPESDIGFTASGELDRVALQNFVGYQNFLNNSEDLSIPGSWGLANITTIQNNTIAPNGTNTAEKIVLNTGNTQRFMNKDTNLNNTTIYTDSYYVKANNGYNFVQLTPSTGFGGGGAYQNYNLSNGTLGSASGIIQDQARIESVGNGWYRISLSATAASTVSGRMVLGIVNSATSARLAAVNVASDTDSIFVWGGQRHISTSLTSNPKPYQQTSTNINTGDGYITTWYDQSGNQNHAVQSTASNQPKIIDGVNGIITQNNKPAIRFDGIDDQLSSGSFNNTGDSTAFFVASRGANNQSFISRLTNYASLQNDLFNPYYLNRSSTVATPDTDPKDSLNLFTTVRSSAINSNLNIGYGTGSTTFLNGHFTELILYNSNILSNRIEIENNLKRYYNTP